MTVAITSENVNRGLLDALWSIKVNGTMNDSRNGRVIQIPEPVVITHTNPTKRVLFSPVRDANPFFHMYEALWMLAGGHDVDSVSYYAKQMAEYSDDGQILWGAYGWRWRGFFGFDQVVKVIELLRNDPKTRRAVIGMWSPYGDLAQATYRVPDADATLLVGGVGSKDVPCNTHIYFDGTRGELNMTVCNRSNDVVWGCFGANAVHLSMLHEFVAGAVGMPIGLYHQFSNNLHLYVDRPDCQRLFTADDANPSSWTVKYVPDDRYGSDFVDSPLFGTEDSWQDWINDCVFFVQHPTADHAHRHPFFREIAGPLMKAFALYKDEQLEDAIIMAEMCLADDWRVAAVEWLQRRLAKRISE